MKINEEWVISEGTVVEYIKAAKHRMAVEKHTFLVTLDFEIINHHTDADGNSVYKYKKLHFVQIFLFYGR